MTELVLEAVSDGALVRADARLQAGVNVVLGADPLALATLVAVASGSLVPARGRVLVDGAAPHATPAARRATASLLADERLPAAPNVSRALELSLRARGDTRTAQTILGEAGLAAWSARSTADLDASERRALGLALALSHAKPRLIALFEPLAAASDFGVRRMIDGVLRATTEGAVALIATASLSDARAFGGSLFALEGGVLNPLDGAPLGGAAGETPLFVVRTNEPRELAAALLAEPFVKSVRTDESTQPGRVTIEAGDIEAVAELVLRLAAAGRATISGIALETPPLEALLAARSGAARAHYDAAYHRAMAQEAASRPAVPAAALAPQTAPAVAWSPPWTSSAPGGWASPQAPAPPVDTTASRAFPGTGATAPADQSVSMPTEFADPTRPPGGRSGGGGTDGGGGSS